MPSAMDELGRTVLTEDMTIGSAPLPCLSSAGARAAENVAQPWALHSPTSRPMLGCGRARFFLPWPAAAAQERLQCSPASGHAAVTDSRSGCNERRGP